MVAAAGVLVRLGLRVGAAAFAAAAIALRVRREGILVGGRGIGTAGGGRDIILSRRQLLRFDRDGYLYLRNALTPSELRRITEASRAVVDASRAAGNSTDASKGPTTFSIIGKGMVFSPPRPTHSPSSSFEMANDKVARQQQEKEIVDAFRAVAMRSKLSQIASELVRHLCRRDGGDGDDGSGGDCPNVRILRYGKYTIFCCSRTNFARLLASIVSLFCSFALPLSLA